MSREHDAKQRCTFSLCTDVDASLIILFLYSAFRKELCLPCRFSAGNGACVVCSARVSFALYDTLGTRGQGKVGKVVSVSARMFPFMGSVLQDAALWAVNWEHAVRWKHVDCVANVCR